MFWSSLSFQEKVHLCQLRVWWIIRIHWCNWKKSNSNYWIAKEPLALRAILPWIHYFCSLWPYH